MEFRGPLVTIPYAASSGQQQKSITQCKTQSSNDNSEAGPRATSPVIPTLASLSPFRRSKTPSILFYDKNARYYEFTNFSPHDVSYKGKRYPTSEHLFQAFKFLDDYPEIADRIRKCGERPMLAFDEAHRYQKWVRPDWRQVHVEKMEIALYHKFTQHPDLKKLLLDTGDAELVEDSPRDYFWGVGADHSGRNKLGKALMRLRAELREERHSDSPYKTARSDFTHLLVHGLTSLVPTRLVNWSRSEERDNLCGVPGAQRDNTRRSIPDFTSHVPQLMFNVKMSHPEDYNNLHKIPDAQRDNAHHPAQRPLPSVPAQPVSSANALHFEEHANFPPPRRDGPYISARSVTPLVPSQLAANANGSRLSAAAVSGSGPSSPQVAQPHGRDLCEFCRLKPKFANHPYCGRTCAAEAKTWTCSFCHSKPCLGTTPCCSRTCAVKAGAAV